MRGTAQFLTVDQFMFSQCPIALYGGVYHVPARSKELDPKNWTHGDSWGPHGDPMGTPWGPHGVPWDPWGPMGTHGNPWGPMGIHGDPWEPMGTHGNPWEPSWALSDYTHDGS